MVCTSKSAIPGTGEQQPARRKKGAEKNTRRSEPGPHHLFPPPRKKRRGRKDFGCPPFFCERVAPPFKPRIAASNQLSVPTSGHQPNPFTAEAQSTQKQRKVLDSLAALPPRTPRRCGKGWSHSSENHYERAPEEVACSSSSNAWAARKSASSKPSVNQP